MFSSSALASQQEEIYRLAIGDNGVQGIGYVCGPYAELMNNVMNGFDQDEPVPQLALENASRYNRLNSVRPNKAGRNVKNCVLMKGLPYEAKKYDIIRFMGDHAKNIQGEGIYFLVSTRLSHFIGEVLVEMCSEEDAVKFMQEKHLETMTCDSKSRFLELRNCQFKAILKAPFEYMPVSASDMIEEGSIMVPGSKTTFSPIIRPSMCAIND